MNTKVIGWNINQRSGMGEGIPQFVIDELLAQNADIIVLTELFKNGTIDYFWKEMERSGYSHAVTRNDGTNEVGILWKDELFTKVSVDSSVITKKENNNPNLLLVELMDASGRLLTVAGCRLRMVDYMKRKEEFEIIMKKVNETENPVLLIGDCNNLRRKTVEQHWNLDVMDNLLLMNRFERHTPDGQSIYTEKAAKGYAYEFAEDHIMTRGLNVSLGPYDRSFVNRDAIAYPWGRDFQRYNPKTGALMSIKAGYPDHAIVKGYISMGDKAEVKDPQEAYIMDMYRQSVIHSVFEGLSSIISDYGKTCGYTIIPKGETIDCDTIQEFMERKCEHLYKEVNQLPSSENEVMAALRILIRETKYVIRYHEVFARWTWFNPNLIECRGTKVNPKELMDTFQMVFEKDLRDYM